MLCRQIFSRQLPQICKFSTSSCRASFVDVKVHSDTGIAHLKMQRPPVNGLNLEHLTELNINIGKLHAEGCRGMILGSAIPKMYSAGLEITEMYQPDEARLREFWRMLQEVFLQLYGSQMATVAAISGHSPAGGCLLSIACDYRIMAEGKFTIGLNEALLGIVAPFWFAETFSNTIGHRQAERALQLGALFTPQEAFNIGLVDRIVPVDEVEQEAETEIKKWLKIPDHARQLSKLQCRQSTIDRLMSRRESDIDNFVSFIMKDSIQKSIGMYLAALKAKSQAKK